MLSLNNSIACSVTISLLLVCSTASAQQIPQVAGEYQAGQNVQCHVNQDRGWINLFWNIPGTGSALFVGEYDRWWHRDAVGNQTLRHGFSGTYTTTLHNGDEIQGVGCLFSTGTAGGF